LVPGSPLAWAGCRGGRLETIAPRKPRRAISGTSWMKPKPSLYAVLRGTWPGTCHLPDVFGVSAQRGEFSQRSGIGLAISCGGEVRLPPATPTAMPCRPAVCPGGFRTGPGLYAPLRSPRSRQASAHGELSRRAAAWSRRPGESPRRRTPHAGELNAGPQHDARAWRIPGCRAREAQSPGGDHWPARRRNPHLVSS
jgi:hypothetical protein